MKLLNGISAPLNKSIQLSRYIAVLDRYFGESGFVFPVTDVIGGVTYSYDLYHPETEKLVKVIGELDVDEICRYAEASATRDVRFILDANRLSGSDDEDLSFEKIDEVVFDVAEELDAVIFLNGEIWELDSEKKWVLSIPVERLKCLDAIFEL